MGRNSKKKNKRAKGKGTGDNEKSGDNPISTQDDKATNRSPTPTEPQHSHPTGSAASETENPASPTDRFTSTHFAGLPLPTHPSQLQNDGDELGPQPDRQRSVNGTSPQGSDEELTPGHIDHRGLRSPNSNPSTGSVNNNPPTGSNDPHTTRSGTRESIAAVGGPPTTNPPVRGNVTTIETIHGGGEGGSIGSGTASG